MVKNLYVSPVLWAAVPGSLLIDALKYTVKMERTEVQIAEALGQERKSKMGAAIASGTLMGLNSEVGTYGLPGYLLYKFGEAASEQSVLVGVASVALLGARVATKRYFARGREFLNRRAEAARQLERLVKEHS